MQVEWMTNLVLFHRTLAAAARAEDLLILLSADESIANSRRGVEKYKVVSARNLRYDVSIQLSHGRLITLTSP